MTSAESQNILIFLRNLIRVVPNLVPVVVGTNVKVVNCMRGEKASCHHASRQSRSLWCRIVLKLPPATLETLDISGLPQNRFGGIEKWIRIASKRPGILALFLENLMRYNSVEPESLKNAFQDSFYALVDSKSSLARPESLNGYFEMIFSNVSISKEHNCSADLTHEHLAHIIPDQSLHLECIPVVKNVFKRLGGDPLVFYPPKSGENLDEYALETFRHNVGRSPRTFKPLSGYLDLSVDELTQMIVFSDWSRMAHDFDANNDLSHIFQEAEAFICEGNLVEAKQHIIRSVKSNSTINILSHSFRMFVEIIYNHTNDGSNRGESIRSGNKMVHLILGSFVKASAAAGPAGDSLEHFMLRFASELSIKNVDGLEWELDSLELLGSIKDQLVPYVIASNYQISSQFRAFAGVFTGCFPALSSNVQLDGQCIPDWVGTLQLSEDNLDATDATVLKNALHLSNRSMCQMYITFEMKSYADNVDADVVKAVLRRAAVNGRNIGNGWPNKGKMSINHLHLFCVSSLATIEDWGLIQSKCSHVLKLLMLTYDPANNKIGLEDMFANTMTLAAKTADNQTPGKNPSDLDIIEGVSPASARFPHTTVVIVSIEDLFMLDLNPSTM